MKTLKTNRKIVLVIGLFATLFLATQVSQAQVKIGEDTAPAKGAVLDLNTTSSGYTGGLKLPNVSITSLTAIPTTFKESVTTTADKAALAGTIVYNTNTNVSANIFPGIYYWDGTKWIVQTTGGSGTSTDAWLTTGNKSTFAGINFLGTTDDQPLIFKTNGSFAGIISNSESGGTSIGYGALVSSSGVYNSALGNKALAVNSSGRFNTAIGADVLSSNTIGEQNTGVGTSALNSNTTGSLNTALGVNAGHIITTGSDNALLGVNAGTAITTGSSNSSFGSYSMNGTGGTASNNSAFGYNSLGSCVGDNNTALGWGAGNYITTGSNNIAIGSNAQVPTATANDQLSIGNWIYGVDGNIGIGTGTPTERLQVQGKVKIVDGSQGAGKVLTSDANGVGTWTAPASNGWQLTGNSGTNPSTNFLGTTDNQPLVFKTNGSFAGIISNGESGGTSIGYGALVSSSGVYNSAFGNKALAVNSSGKLNTAIGADALSSNTSGEQNTGVGTSTLNSNTTGSFNTALGLNAGSTIITGSNNTVSGVNAGTAITTGSFNSSFGSYSLNGPGGMASNNSAFGYNALGSCIGDNNTALGWGAGNYITEGENNIAIGYNAQVPDATASNQLSIGNWIYGVGGYIGIGTNTPSQKLHVAGNAYVSSHEWVGGNLGIGVTQGITPSQKLHVAGNGYITGDEWVGNRVAIGTVTQGTTPTAGIQLAKNSEEKGGDIDMYSTKGSLTGNSLSPTINFYSPRGTYASPTNNGSGDVIGSLIFWPRVAGSYDQSTGVYATYTENGTTLFMTATYQIGGNRAWTNTSDVRLKTNITPIKYGLSEILKLKPVNYEMKDNLGVPHVGFIAQDVKPIIPEVVVGEEGDLSKKEVLSISYAEFAPVLTKAIQEQQEMIEIQQKIIEQLEFRIKALETK